MCHEPGPPAAKRAPDAPPRYHEAALRASPHAGLECNACHSDLEGQEFPHPKPKRVERSGCASKLSIRASMKSSDMDRTNPDVM